MSLFLKKNALYVLILLVVLWLGITYWLSIPPVYNNFEPIPTQCLHRETSLRDCLDAATQTAEAQPPAWWQFWNRPIATATP